MIEIKNISQSYGQNKVLHDIILPFKRIKLLL